MAVFFILGIIMTTQITLQLDLTTDTTGNAEQVARMIGVSAWRISGDYLIVENPLLDYRVTNNETYSHKTDRIPNGAVVILVQDELNTTEQKIEQEIQAKGLNAPRLSPDDIDSVITGKHFFTAADGDRFARFGEQFAMEEVPQSLECLTFCVLVLKNGFTVTGESACASPENYDAKIGKEIAYKNAREKIWMLEGYLLKQHLYNYSIIPTESNIKAELQVNSDNGSEPTPELPKLSNCAAVKPIIPTNVGECIHRTKLLNNRENAYLLTQLLNTPNINSVLRKKAETKMIDLLDQLV